MVAGAVSQFTETVNMPTAGKANRGNENVVLFMFVGFTRSLLPLSPQSSCPPTHSLQTLKREVETLLQLKEFNPTCSVQHGSHKSHRASAHLKGDSTELRNAVHMRYTSVIK